MPEDSKRRRLASPFRFRPQVDDDLLTGFTKPESRRRDDLRAFLATTLAISLLVWDLAFTFGAYRTVFYYRLLQIFVVSIVLLLGALVLRRQLTVRPWMLAIVSIPVIWLVWRLLAPAGGHWPPVYRLVEGALVDLTLLTLPVTLWVVLRILAPNYFELSSLRLRLAGLAIVSVVAVAGFLTGQFNYHVITCESFVVAGDDQPSNCRRTR
ncbi:MAG TPA: hypothetical protein VFC19_20035 [Candidatus Limnocylindrales bacterium]|nr:hypothetical protein [Candidatus Limnocylindrales bacterium]